MPLSQGDGQTEAINIDNSPSGHAYLPVFEDAVSIQSAISDVCEMMLHRRIETKEASILLYAMQVASTNMAHMNGDKGQRKRKSPSKKKQRRTQLFRRTVLKGSFDRSRQPHYLVIWA